VVDLLRILIIAVVGMAAALGALFLLDALLPLHPKGLMMPTIFVGSAMAGAIAAVRLLRAWPSRFAEAPRQEPLDASKASSDLHA
jgi:hypothetical protein